MSQELATNVDPKFGHWGYKATLPLGPVYIYGDVCHLMLAQSEKMDASLSDIVRYMTLVLPTQVIPFFTAKKRALSLPTRCSRSPSLNSRSSRSQS